MRDCRVKIRKATVEEVHAELEKHGVDLDAVLEECRESTKTTRPQRERLLLLCADNASDEQLEQLRAELDKRGFPGSYCILTNFPVTAHQVAPPKKDELLVVHGYDCNGEQTVQLREQFEAAFGKRTPMLVTNFKIDTKNLDLNTVEAVMLACQRILKNARRRAAKEKKS